MVGTVLEAGCLEITVEKPSQADFPRCQPAQKSGVGAPFLWRPVTASPEALMWPWLSEPLCSLQDLSATFSLEDTAPDPLS